MTPIDLEELSFRKVNYRVYKNSRGRFYVNEEIVEDCYLTLGGEVVEYDFYDKHRSEIYFLILEMIE
jgi:hypothetical protein